MVTSRANTLLLIGVSACGSGVDSHTCSANSSLGFRNDSQKLKTQKKDEEVKS